MSVSETMLSAQKRFIAAATIVLGCLFLEVPQLHAAPDSAADAGQTAETPVEKSADDAAADQADSEAESAATDPGALPDVDVSALNNSAEQLTLAEQIDLFEQRLLQFEESRESADEIFEELRDQVRLRLWQFDMALDRGRSVFDVADVDPAELEKQHPGFPAGAYELPPGVVTMSDLHTDLLEVYAARNRMLTMVGPKTYQQAVGTELYGIQELWSELDLAILEVRYQALRLPQAFYQIRRMLTQAPVPLIWFAVQLWLAILIFRWWRRWLPGTLQRMRSGLLSIRPRTQEVLTRLKALWYVDQVRPPLEWLLLFMFLFGLFHFDGLEFVRDIGSIIVRWILLAWFAVILLNAVVARGAGGLAGESAKLRMKSMRLIAIWLVLLGLGQELSVRLAGEASLNVWVWRVFQLLSFPLALRLLSIWHMELYRRLQREGEPYMPLEQYAAQRGPRRWAGSAKIGGILLASWLQSALLQRIDRIDPGRAANRAVNNVVERSQVTESLPPEIRQQLIAGPDASSRYSQDERRLLMQRIDAQHGGVVGVIGERGIGKAAFLRQLSSANEYGTIGIDCANGSFDSILAQFCSQLSLDAEAKADAINTALSANDVRLITLNDLHLLARPVIGGFSEFSRLVEFMSLIKVELLWVYSIDRFAYQLVSRVRPESSMPSVYVQLRSWSENQIGDLIESRCKAADLQPDYSRIRVPRQYMDTAQDAIDERNKAGTFAMITSLSRGNPSIALRLFADCINMRDDGTPEATLPANPDAFFLERASDATLLILRVICQLEKVVFADIVENLRFDEATVRTLIHTAVMRGWIKDNGGRFSITSIWYRPITRVLERKNFLVVTQKEIV